MKRVLLSLFLISFLNVLSQDSCVVKIFPGDCQNCYIGMKSIETGDESIKKTIVFPELSKAEVNAYLRRVLNISDISKFSIIVSDSVYNSMNSSITSEVYVYNENKLCNHSLLKKFYGFADLGSYEIKIPDSIAISIAATILNHDDYFFITDSKFGDCIFINKHGDHEINVIKSQYLTTELNFNKLSGDTICYQMFSKYREVLQSANMDRMKFKSSFGKRHNMASFLMAPDIQVKNGEAGLTYKTGIIIFESPKEYRIFSIDEESLPENYIAFPGFYSEYNGDYYIQLAHIDRARDDQYVLGKFLLENEKFVFSKFLDYKIPSEYLPSKKFKSLRKVISAANPYVFLQYSLSYFNIDNDQTYLLPFDSVNLDLNFQNMDINSLKLHFNYQIVDAYVSKETIRILYKESDSFHIALIDRSDHKLIKKMEVANQSESLKSGMYFYSADKLFYLTTDNTIVVEKINYK